MPDTTAPGTATPGTTAPDTTAPGTTTPATADPRPWVDRATAQLAALVDGVRPEQLQLPTPCTEWDVRALLEHIVAGTEAYAVIGETGADEAPDGVRSRALPEDVPGRAAVFATARERLAAGWSDDAKLEQLYVLPFAELPGRATLAAYMMEAAAHAWDLARALDDDRPLDEELGEAALAAAHRMLPPERRGGPTPFEAVRPAPEGTGVYGRLAAWLGREPGWRG